MFIGLGMPINGKDLGELAPPAPDANTLLLDFESTTSGATFTRTSNAWQLNGALVAHNVLLQSNTFDTTWTITNGSITKNATDPFGVANNAWTLIPSNVSNANHWLAQSITFASAGVFSFYVKTAGYTFVRAANSPNNYVEFDLSAVTATYGTGWSGASITAVGNGWYRCAMTQSNSTNWASVVITATPASYNVNATYTFAGDGISGVILYGAQLNAYSLTTYVPTTSAAVYLPRYEQGKSGLGILIEGSTTNKLSAADSQSITTSATCTTTAAVHTVSVLTGSLTLSGTMTGTVTPGNPVTATASAGTLTLTGTATLAQVEAKAYATSWVIGGATRNAETLTFNPQGIIAHNLLTYSNTFTSWISSGVIVPTQTLPDPTGLANNAWLFTDDSTSTAEFKYAVISLVTGTTYTFSAWVKQTSGATVYPSISADDGSRVAGCTIDTNNATATLWTAYTGFTVLTSSVSVGTIVNGWFRVSLTFTTQSSSNHNLALYPAVRSTPNASTGINDVTLQGSNGFYGAQLNSGSVATAYVPTTSAGSSQGTISCWVYVGNWKSDSNYHVFFDTSTAGTNANRVELYKSTTANNYVFATYNAAGAGSAPSITSTLSNGWHHFVGVWGSNTKLYIDGALASDSGTNNIPAAVGTNAYIGTETGNSLWLDSIIDQFRIYNRALTASEVLQLYRAGR